jgi:hypothetical protein
MSPQTFEAELRLVNQWKITGKYKGMTSVDTMDLPVNMRKYTLLDRIRKVA